MCVCVSVFGSVICEFIFIAEQMLHRKTAQPCAVCCSCRRRNTQKVANKEKYTIDSCWACLCTCLYKCINVVNTHTHSCCKWLLAIASTIYSNWLSKCLLSHFIALLLSPVSILLFIPFSSFLYLFLSTFVYSLFKILLVSPLHIFSSVSFYKSSQCESPCIHHCFSAVIFDSINPFAADDNLFAVLAVPACVNSEFSK